MTIQMVYHFSIGDLKLVENNGQLTEVLPVTSPQTVQQQEHSELLAKAARQIKEYLAGQRQKFDLPLAFTGTAFQQQVWQYLLTIPYGETRTYQAVARAIGKPQAVRAVGHAIGQNKLLLVVPCHRVLGKNGSLTGYAGGLAMKKQLLALEHLHQNKN
ncbi:MAG: methylated-DNA--[protein]-cysteine S-methyltransferase [Lactobacillus sp.]|nr:methylated-DNA--[protein]-cysteine S-methyltransferase [Lactobacillus sp.]MCH3906318.1 methylated-DNA--[protein]-cysteine S-methyltransferase [Lactobacillus sp.]MCH3990108.1 methylated-DNA--[protein]-cysteine S-methyltransferase [Lactobacillus sp.]MCH4069178.1 methylated-DNA--[protein]-cysteine S-methyltransferase [Lactobacillus sp.]MCI1303480.1 methylated-DNA--[protein]-cysteine S-methyltransferase [Lactobacillus sp.]